MSSSFEISPVESITAGAVGEPGARTFYIQARGGGMNVSLLCEKEQIFLLAQALTQLVSALGEQGDEPAPGDLELDEPVIPEWRVGEIGLEYDEDADLIIIVAREMLESEDDEADIDNDDDDDADRAIARFGATRAQVSAMAEHAAEVVAAGRPRCPLCGTPLPEEGAPHGCAATNGHRKPV